MPRNFFSQFFIFLIIVLIFIGLKSGRIFDIGILFRHYFIPENITNRLLKQPENLSEDYQKLLVENSNLKNLAEENKQLRELLNFKNIIQKDLVVANIINRDPINNNILIINAGKNNKVDIGQAVIINNGVMVGKVIAVGDDYAQVRLITDQFSRLAVTVGGEQKISGIVTGTLGLSLNLSFVPQELEIKKGDLIYSASSDPKVPAGLVVGQVDEVKFEQEDLFKQASATTLVSLDSLSLVAVITGL